MSIYANPFLSLGGELPPGNPEDEENMSWWEKFGKWLGEVDLYDKQMGIPSKDYGAMFAQGQGNQAASLGELAALARISTPKQQKPQSNFIDMMQNGHLRTLLGG